MGIMTLAELSIHNAVRSYARQQQIGRALGVRRAFTPAQAPQEKVALSNEARNLQQIRQVAAVLVRRLRGDLSPLVQLSLAAALEQETRVRYAGRLKGELVSADVIKGWMGSVKLAG
jgi:hypothetical protein